RAYSGLPPVRQCSCRAYKSKGRPASLPNGPIQIVIIKQLQTAFTNFSVFKKPFFTTIAVQNIICNSTFSEYLIVSVN
ncbi:hypothetical protein, partial [Prevotella sp.]|uniref:hypothetical protein n=1 Tax=Prevotella sp. TaxID=59823 RepID=UPI00307B5EDA